MSLKNQKSTGERCTLKNASAQTTVTPNEASLARQLDFFESRCEILADRIRAGELNFIDGVDMAYSAAQWSGLVDAIGDDNVQLVLRATFMNAPRRE